MYYTVILSLSKACKYWRIYVDILDNESSNIIKNNKLCLVDYIFYLILPNLMFTLYPKCARGTRKFKNGLNII